MDLQHEQRYEESQGPRRTGQVLLCFRPTSGSRHNGQLQAHLIIAARIAAGVTSSKVPCGILVCKGILEESVTGSS